MNKALLQQLALAKQAGTQAMAKDFFAKPPGPGTDPAAEAEEAVQTSAEGASASAPEGEAELTPEQLEELLAQLQSQG